MPVNVHSHIIGLSRRKLIRVEQYNVKDFSNRWPLMQRLECSPEMMKEMFELNEYCSEQQIRMATVDSFLLQGNGLSQLIMRDVQDTSSYILALACTSASSLEELQVWCRREKGGCGCHGLLRQPCFDYLKMALCKLTFECTSVWDLSSIENCSLMESLRIYGCLSARKWPGFGKMASLRELEVLCPGSLAYWPSGLQTLNYLCIRGSNQIPLEELQEVVTSMDSWHDWLCSFAALEVLVDDVYFSRKDNICIAKALMENDEKLLSIIDQMLVIPAEIFLCLAGTPSMCSSGVDNFNVQCCINC